MEENPQLAKTVLGTNSDPNATRIPASAAVAGVLPQAVRTTVLPKVEYGEQPKLSVSQRERYEEIAPLGQGGMGEVVLLRDHDIDREVALKRLPPNAGIDQVARFVEEIHAVGQLEHPNIMPVHDVGLDERGRYFFVMKRLKGQTLEQIIEKLRRGDAEAHAHYTFAVRQQIFLGILHAMDFAHKQGFLHRDLKPANIMVGPFGEVTVMDWGLAKRIHGPELPAAAAAPQAATDASVAPAVIKLHTLAGQVMGTPFYMSPEQVRGESDRVNERTDIYALTVILHELMYLDHYLEGRETLEDIGQGIQTVVPDLLKKHPSQPLTPPEIAHFINRGMAKEPEDRFQSVEEMIARLQRGLAGSVMVQCPRTLIKRILQEVTSAADAHPFLSMGIGAALILLAGAGLVRTAMLLF